MLDLTKPLQTTDGNEVKLISKNGWNEEYPLGFLIINNNGDDFSWFSYDGEEYSPDYLPSYEIINKPTKVTKWMNVYRSILVDEYHMGMFFNSKKEAEDYGKDSSEYLASVKVEWEE